MKLVESAVAAHTARVEEGKLQQQEWLKQQAEEIKQWVEVLFGMPFTEAFDVSKVTFTDFGSAVIDAYIYIVLEDDGMRITVYKHDDNLRFVGQELFVKGGPEQHEQNLVALGRMLVLANITQEVA